MSPRGRRPGRQDTRDAILDAARTLFAAHGYERASLRAIGARAGVDPALILHYFGSKRGMLEQAMQLPVDPRIVLADVFDAPRDRMGEALVRAVLTAWEQPAVRQHLLGLLRTGASDDTARAALQSTLHDSVQSTVAALVTDAPETRSALVMTQMAGLAFTRYFLQVPEVVALDPEQLVTVIGPTVQRYLTGDLY